MILSGRKISAAANAGRQLGELSKRPVNIPNDARRTATASARRERGETINKWSHNNTMAFKRPTRFQTSRTRKSGASINLILSVAFGLVLAAIHSSAFSGETINSSGARSGPLPPSSSPAHQSDTNQSNHNQQKQQQQELAKSSVQQSQKSPQQPTISSRGALTSKQSFSLNSESPSINLIPIDQPMLSSADSAPGPSATSPASIARTMSLVNANNNNLRQDDSYDGSRLNLRSGSVEPNSDPSSPPAGSHEAPNEDFGIQAQQQQSIVDEDFAEPVGQFYANQNELNGPVVSSQQSEGQQQDPSRPAAKQSQSSRQLERRFGLFKKGHFQQQQQHFGTPAKYLANPFMSECERCLAGFSQQQTAELQLDPTPTLPAPSPPPPPPTLQPVQPVTLTPQMSHFPMQPFAPLKNKFFMKFPFLMKGNTGGFDHIHSPLLAAPTLSSYQATAHYWPLPASSLQPYSSHHQHHSSHHQHRPMSQALFVRPAPAYNCVQASPTVLAAAASATSQAEVIPLLSQTKTSALSGGGGATKQHHYANQHHHQQQQQQVQSGYAKK